MEETLSHMQGIPPQSQHAFLVESEHSLDDGVVLLTIKIKVKVFFKYTGMIHTSKFT